MTRTKISNHMVLLLFMMISFEHFQIVVYQGERYRLVYEICNAIAIHFNCLKLLKE